LGAGLAELEKIGANLIKGDAKTVSTDASDESSVEGGADRVEKKWNKGNQIRNKVTGDRNEELLKVSEN